MNEKDTEAFNALLERCGFLNVMDAIAAKYQGVPRPKRNAPGWSFHAIIFDDRKREFRFTWGPFAGEPPSSEDEKSPK